MVGKAVETEVRSNAERKQDTQRARKTSQNAVVGRKEGGESGASAFDRVGEGESDVTELCFEEAILSN